MKASTLNMTAIAFTKAANTIAFSTKFIYTPIDTAIATANAPPQPTSNG